MKQFTGVEGVELIFHQPHSNHCQIKLNNPIDVQGTFIINWNLSNLNALVKLYKKVSTTNNRANKTV